MRRVLPFPGIARDRSANAPYAVVAVIVLLGAGMSYAYLAHLESTRLHLDGLEPWSDQAIDQLDREEARFREAVRSALSSGIEARRGARSQDLVSAIGMAAGSDLEDWARASYPSHRTNAIVSATLPRLSLSSVYGTVTTGNALGMQLPQRLPVGLEAVGASTISVAVAGGASASRAVVARVTVTEPMVLAAYLQDVLEHSLADEGLVMELLQDALVHGLEEEIDWTPSEGALENGIDGAIGVVERALFRSDTGVSALMMTAGGTVSGPDLLGPGRDGDARVRLPAESVIRVSRDDGGEPVEVRLVPWLDWRALETDVRVERLWSAEAGGPEGAAVARLDLAGRFDHRVDVWQNGACTGSVSREVQFRDHLVAFAEDTSPDDGRHMGRAQVEDWGGLRSAMDVASPPLRWMVLDVDPRFGDEVEVSLDGVYLGVMGRGSTRLDNVPAGPHQLLVRSADAGNDPLSYTGEVVVPASRDVDMTPVAPNGGADAEAAYAFWFALMASLHREDAGPLAYLEHLAALSGYEALPGPVRREPRSHLAELAFWTEGLERHMEHRGGDLGPKGAPDPLEVLSLAKEVVSLSKLAFTLLTKLPKTALGAGELVVELASEEGRASFVVRVETKAESLELLTGQETVDGGCEVTASLGSGAVLARAKDTLSALSIITKGISIGFDVVRVVDALQEGDPAEIAWAAVDLQIDLAQLVISLIKFGTDVQVLVLPNLASSALTVVGAAISVVAAFLDAYRDAGGDFWGAFELLLHPDGFGEALRTAGFLSAVATLVTTVVVTMALHVSLGIGLAVAFSMAVTAATGVGLIVLAAVLAVWAVLHWEDVSCWVHGTVPEDDIEDVERDVGDLLGSTMELRARLNTVDVASEIVAARSQRGVGLALLHLRTTSGDAGLVEALAGAPLHHLDGGSSQGRRARAVAEARHWTTVLWMEVDDLVDEDHRREGDESSEGFADDRGYLGKDHTFDADIRVTEAGGDRYDLAQDAIGDFLDSLRPDGLEGLRIGLDVDGDVFKEALEDWVDALEAVAGQLGEATAALARSAMESTYSVSGVSEAAYDRTRTLVEIRLPDTVGRARVRVECADGAALVDGRPAEGPVVVNVTGGTALLVVTGRSVASEVLTYSSDVGFVDVVRRAEGTACAWYDLGFGRSALVHAEA